MPGASVRGSSLIASPWRIPMPVAGVAARLYQSRAAGLDVLQGGGVDEGAVASGGMPCAVEIPADFALLGQLGQRVVRGLLSSPGGADGAECTHGDRVAAG